MVIFKFKNAQTDSLLCVKAGNGKTILDSIPINPKSFGSGSKNTTKRNNHRGLSPHEIAGLNDMERT
jgi:hypothetical protein